MKSKLKKIVKYLYFNVFYKLMKILPIKENKIIYISHYGNRFGCNPQSIFNYIREEEKDYKHIIVLNNQDAVRKLDISGPDVKFVRYQSIAFLKELATAKYWVVNANLPPALKPKASTVYLQTWHGAGAFKKFGMDLPEKYANAKEEWMKDTANWTKMLCSAESVRSIYANACHIPEEIIHPIGLPRNDVFYKTDKINEAQLKFKEKYNILNEKKIILYAPTYRDEEEKNTIQFDFVDLENQIGDQYVFLLKLHPIVAAKSNGINENQFLRSFSNYEDIQELLIVADLLITDYSSVIFDFAITGKPIVFYSYDLEEYDQRTRGFYYPYKEWVPGPIVYTQNELINKVRDYENLYESQRERVLAFGENYNANTNGNSTEEAVKLLLGEK